MSSIENCKLVVIEGFDSIGKDTLYENFKKYVSKHFTKNAQDELYFYEPVIDRSTFPDYRKDKEQFKQWLIQHTKREIEELNELSKKYKYIIMVRFVLTDMVYSRIFGREHIVEQLVKEGLNKDISIFNYVLLWDSYFEYAKRWKKITGTVIPEYSSKEEFENVQSLYEKFYNHKLFLYGDLRYVRNFRSQVSILNDFEEWFFTKIVSNLL